MAMDQDTGDNQPAASSSLLALAAVAARLGVDAGVDQLRRRFALAAGEPDTSTLIAMAREFGLDARVLRVTFEELPRLARTLPAILRARDGAALILEEARTDPAKGTVAVIRDPATAEDALVAVDELQLAGVWGGETILIKRVHAATDEQQPFGIRWLAAQVFRERKLFGDIAVGALVSTVFALAPPFMVMIIMNRVLVNHSYATLNVLTGVILVLLVFETVLASLRRILTQVATTRIDGRLNLYIVERLLKLPMDYFEHVPTGRTLSKLNAVWRIRNFLTGQLFGAVLDAVPLIGLVPAMLILDWRTVAARFRDDGHHLLDHPRVPETHRPRIRTGDRSRSGEGGLPRRDHPGHSHDQISGARGQATARMGTGAWRSRRPRSMRWDSWRTTPRH